MLWTELMKKTIPVRLQNYLLIQLKIVGFVDYEEEVQIQLLNDNICQACRIIPVK